MISKLDGNKNDNEVFLFCDDSYCFGGMYSDIVIDVKSLVE